MLFHMCYVTTRSTSFFIFYKIIFKKICYLFTFAKIYFVEAISLEEMLCQKGVSPKGNTVLPKLHLNEFHFAKTISPPNEHFALPNIMFRQKIIYFTWLFYCLNTKYIEKSLYLKKLLN